MAGVTARPRLLFLCQTLPYPPDGGVWIRTYHVLRLLARAFEITALCFERSGRSTTSDAPHAASDDTPLHRLADVEIFPLPQRHSRARFVWDHLRSVAMCRVYTHYLYESRAFRRRLTHHLTTGHFDLVHADSLDLARYLPACAPLPVVCVHHDIESDLLGRRAAVERDWWKRAYFGFQSRLMAEVERESCDRLAMNVVCSDRDRTELKRLAPFARAIVVSNGVDTTAFQPDRTPESGVAFVGGAHPFPNLDALSYFSEQILPHLRASDASAAVRWIGRASAEQQQFYREQHGIELTGYVDDVRLPMREAACHIVPLRIGGGTRLKVLNAWAMGKAVVSTSCGCEGLAAIDGENILMRDDPRAFADAVADVLHDAVLRRRLGQAGRATVERLYSWDAIAPGMIDTYLTLANVECSRSVSTASPVRQEARYGIG